ncbi:hypothetical protein BJ912DRAFT_944605 [Pholiota molesta]|nr:hypothetical protein BJ912DRAFT_944605 [Pholiota molesta]
MDTSFHSLPLEIQDSIVDELGAMLSEDRKSAHLALLSCHRASRSLPISRSIKPISILKDVILSPKGTLGRLILGDEDVISILQALCKEDYGVQDFILSLVITSESEHVFHLLEYADLPSDFRLAFSALSRSPHIRSLQIQYENPFRCLIATRLPNSAAASIRGTNTNQASQVERDDTANEYSVAMCTDYAFPYDEMLPQSYYRRLSSLVAYNTGAKHAMQTWKLVDLSSDCLRSLSIFQYVVQPWPNSQAGKLHLFTRDISKRASCR